MKVALLDVDGYNFPNLALAKLSTYHKTKGDDVEWYNPLFSNPDVIYASKVFTFTSDYLDYNPKHMDRIVKGGTGYNRQFKLPAEVENCLPDLTLYPQYDFAYGFLTRGCINKCPWCIVPEKEGNIKIVDTLERVSQSRKEVVLMDNNFLAAPMDFIKSQLEFAIKNKIKLDFNQALDCRLVDEEKANLLAKVKWIKYIRFACDQLSQLEPLKRAISLLRKKGYKKEVQVYVLAKELEDSLFRINEILKIDKTNPFVMPYRDFNKDKAVDLEIKRLARWCNRVEIRKTVKWSEYHE